MEMVNAWMVTSYDWKKGKQLVCVSILEETYWDRSQENQGSAADYKEHQKSTKYMP